MPGAPEKILDLVKRFEQQIDSFKAGRYNETQLRREFLDPFWFELGWDVENKDGYAEAYKDVIHEDAIKVGEATKAPDYCFRIGGTRKFFLEAKKPSVDIKEAFAPAYQLRRYAWSAKLPLSILTDFEEFAVYDCRTKPSKEDKPSFGRIFYCTFREYAEKWDWIYERFSRDAILKGSFDKFAESNKGKRGTTEVDEAFLEEISDWRKRLAENLALRNARLSQRELNFAVQRIIDRIIFLRICEDRGIEDYGRLLALVNGDRIYRRLTELFEDADTRYNSGLFHFKKEPGRHEAPDELTLDLDIDDKLLRDIFRRLYYPDSPYQFSVLSADILGQVYEQFLGKVIRLTEGHRAAVDDKPEVKKAGGVYYTPTYIVDYIVLQTVGKLAEGRTPKQVEKIKILDPACGSGSFLIGAYQFLLDWHLKYYLANDPEKWAKGNKPALVQTSKGWRLTIDARKRILLNNLYGVDIDTQAVEVTKLSLLLKVLEGEAGQTLQTILRIFHERVLPDLGDNIKCGNSLIGPDFYQQGELSLLTEDEKYRINVFDWHAEFPAIFRRTGSTGELHDAASTESDYTVPGVPLHGSYNYKKLKGKKDAPSVAPMESEWEGGFDAVIGNPPYGATLSKLETRYLSGKFKHQEYQLDSYLLFVEHALSIACEGGLIGMIIPNTWLLNLSSPQIRREILNNTKIEEIVHYRYPVFVSATVDTEIIIFRRQRPSTSHRVNISICEKDRDGSNYNVSQQRWRDGDGKPVNIFEKPEFADLADKLKSLFRLEDLFAITQGAKPFQVGKGKPKQTRKIVDDKPFVSEKKKDSTFRPLLRGSLINKYRNFWNKDYWISLGDWLAEPRYSANYDAPAKLVVRQTGDSLIATLDREKFVVRDNLYTIVPKSSDINLSFVLGVINSSLLNWFYQNILNPERGEALAQVKRGHLAELPIPALKLSISSDKARHDWMVNLVEQMLDLNQKLAVARTPQEKIALERQITATDVEIDRLVYQIYGLTDDEIKLVEENAG